MFGLFKVEKKINTPAEEKLDQIRQLLFPPLQLKTGVDEKTEKPFKYHIDFSADSNLDSVLSDLRDGYNDGACQSTVEDVIERLYKVRELLDAYMEIDKDAAYILVDNKKDEVNVEAIEEDI